MTLAKQRAHLAELAWIMAVQLIGVDRRCQLREQERSQRQRRQEPEPQ